MKRDAKLYVVVDRALAPGLQISQAMHAAHAFAAQHPACEAEWYATSNTLAVLSAPGDVLVALEHQARALGVRAAPFFEVDLDEQLTAIALEPGELSARLCRGLLPALSPARALVA